jgi:hypothetical protein
MALDSRMRVLLWDRYIEIKKHECIRIPPWIPHALIALDQPCRVLEMAEGHYDQGADIVRLDDIYGRRKRGEPDDGFV